MDMVEMIEPVALGFAPTLASVGNIVITSLGKGKLEITVISIKR
jgi:hypothetical protein